jgi:hypothetical protein
MIDAAPARGWLVERRVNTFEDSIHLFSGSTPIVPDRGYEAVNQYAVVGGVQYELRLIANTCGCFSPTDSRPRVGVLVRLYLPQ